MWWNGPAFLMMNEDQWPVSIVSISPDESLYKAEFKKIIPIISNVVQQSENPFIVLLNKSSRTFPVKWKIAHVLRFIHNCKARKNQKPKRLGPINVDDLYDAEITLARIHQIEHFPQEFKMLLSKNQVAVNSRIKNLAPFMDTTDYIIRVGGRLKHASHINEAHKHPIILPKCKLATLIIRETHQRNLHTGQQATLGIVTMKFWIINAKSIVRKECHNCIKCFRVRPKMIEQFMGQLPKSRISPAPVFFNTGIDYAGPIMMKSGYTRNAKKHEMLHRPLHLPRNKIDTP